jgi:hypothetical protein
VTKDELAALKANEKILIYLRFFLSLILLLSGIYTVLSGGHPAGVENFFYVAMGAVIGYWLR